MKSLKNIVIVMLIAVVAFNFLPTVSSNATITGFSDLQSGTKSSQSTMVTQYLGALTGETVDVLPDKAAEELGVMIANKGIEIANTLGNGAASSYSGTYTRGTLTQFHYSQTGGGYGSFTELDNSIKSMKADSSKTCSISCVAAATYPWQAIMPDVPGLYQRGASTACGSTAYGAVLEGDGTVEYIQKNARPGDLIFWTAANDKYNSYENYRYDGTPHYLKGAWSHGELYIGPYKDEANGIDIPYARVGSNDVGWDWCIKPFVGTSKGKKVYMVSLQKYFEYCGLDKSKYNLGVGVDAGDLSEETYDEN